MQYKISFISHFLIWVSYYYINCNHSIRIWRLGLRAIFADLAVRDCGCYDVSFCHYGSHTTSGLLLTRPLYKNCYPGIHDIEWGHIAFYSRLDFVRGCMDSEVWLCRGRETAKATHGGPPGKTVGWASAKDLRDKTCSDHALPIFV